MPYGLDDLVSRSAVQSPDSIAVIDGSRCLTFAELERRVDVCARSLSSAGIRQGETVAWQLPNCIEFVVLFCAVLRLRAVALPIVPIMRDREVIFMCRESEAVALVVARQVRGYDHAALAERVRAALPTIRAIHVIDLDGDEASWSTAALTQEPTLLRPPVDPLDVAAVIYTSGTESSPKGVLHSHTTLRYDAESMVSFVGLSREDVFFMPSPLAHITGLLNGIVAPMLLGATTVLQRTWEPIEALDLVRRHRCTYTVVATPFLRQMLQSPDAERSLASLRFVRCGGADIPRDMMEAAERTGVTVLRVYGLSEVPTVTCVPPDTSLAGRVDSDGVPIDNVQLRVVDDHDLPVAPGQEGELLAAGPEMFLGYADASLNNATFTDDGLVRTGDLGFVDDAGRLHVTGRSKDIIVRGGENISAREVEDALLTSPLVEEVAVVGIADPLLGQRACAFVVSSAAPPPDVDQLREIIQSAGLAVQKSPERVVVVAQLPRTPSGKVMKAHLRIWARSNRSCTPTGSDVLFTSGGG